MTWYRDGLYFSCTRCGHCCQAGGPVWVTDGDIIRLAAAVDLSIEEFTASNVVEVYGKRSLRSNDGRCVLLDGTNCRAYDVRPRQCRKWPFWRSNLTREYDWLRACNQCPGAGQGRLYTMDDIEGIKHQ